MDKLQQYLKSELDALREKGIFSLPRELETEQKATVVIDGHEVITLSSNNYLGLTVNPRLKELAIQAIEALWRWFRLSSYYRGHYVDAQ